MQIKTLFAKLIGEALEKGWTFVSLFDGEETVKSIQDAVKLVGETEEFQIRFRNDHEGRNGTVSFIMQAGKVSDVIYDWSLSIDSMVTPFLDRVGETEFTV
jgi:hypothetical protein